MEDIDELLRTNIYSILNSISDETVNDIIQAVKYVGLESLSDLEFVQEKDLMLVLSPIPRRKLLKAWSYPIVLPSSASDLPPLHFAPPAPDSPSLHFATSAPDSPPLHFAPPAPDSPSLHFAPPASDSHSLHFATSAPDSPPLHFAPPAPDSPSLHFATSAPDYLPLHFATSAPDSPPPKSQRMFKKSSLKCKWSYTKRFTLLQTYIKYVKELSSPNVDEQGVWRKIAKEVREKCSLNCDVAQCRYQIDGLRSMYERIKDKDLTNRYAIMLRNEGRKAFMDVEKSVTPNPQVIDKVKADTYVAPFMIETNRTVIPNPQGEDNVKTDRYVAPFMREDFNRRGESMALSRGKINEPATVRVKNLSENVRDSDLRELFRPFGTIARIYIAKSKLTGLPKGVAFIKYHRRENATKAIAVGGFEYDNQILNVEWARPRQTNEILE